MAQRTQNRRDITPVDADAAAPQRSTQAVLRLQREIGNRATGQVLARAPAPTGQGTVHIGKLGAIKIVGGNASDWAAKKEPRTLEITSRKGRHSAELERLSKRGNKLPGLKVTTPIVDQSGQYLDFGSVELDFANPVIAGYTVDGQLETWRAIKFDGVRRLTISHKTGI